MAQKAEIQYVSQFYDYGESASQKKKRRKQEREEKPVKIHTFHVDLVALCGILSALVLLSALIFGGLHLNGMWRQNRDMSRYLSQLKTDNAQLMHAYSGSYTLEDIRTMADTLGLVPESEMEVRYVRVTHPEPEPEPTYLDNVLWFLKGLFSNNSEGVPVE